MAMSLRRQVESFTRIDSLPRRLKSGEEGIVMPKKPVGVAPLQYLLPLFTGLVEKWRCKKSLQGFEKSSLALLA